MPSSDAPARTKESPVNTHLVGVDIGGTAIKAVAIEPDGHVLRRLKVPTPQKDAEGTRTAAAVAQLLSELEAAPGAAGMAAPGIIDAARGIVLHSHNLGWRELPLADLVSARWGCRIPLGHDVGAGAAAEHRWGAGADGPGLTAFLPVGTGISIAFAGTGAPAPSPWAGEIGMLAPFPEPHPGLINLESVTAAPAIARAGGRDSARAVAAAVQSGDATATAAWNAAVEALADALAWVTALLAPQRIVIGGGVADAGDTLLVPLRDAVAHRLTILPAPMIVRAKLGPWAGAIGAALLAPYAEAASLLVPELVG